MPEPPSPSEISRRETRLFAWGMAGMFVWLFGYYALTLQPPLPPPALTLFGLVSAALAAGYLLLVPRSLEQPRGENAPLYWYYPLTSAAWAFLLTWLLRGATPVYFYLAAFDDYVSLALLNSRRAAAAWLAVVLGEMALVYTLVDGAQAALTRLLGDLPLLALVGALAELVARLWEERECAEALTAELDAAYRQLQDYTAQAEALAVAHERARLAHEIHDTLGHTLTALGVQLELLRHLPPEQRAEREQALDQARRLSDGAQVDVWRAIQALRPPPLERLSLDEALQQLTRDFARRLGRDVQWQVSGQPQPLSEDTSLGLYRALQEALTNVQRHALDAEQVAATLHYTDEWVSLKVENSPAASSPPGRREGGFGLPGLEERARRLGGHLEAGHTPEGGFRLLVRLPLSGDRL